MHSRPADLRNVLQPIELGRLTLRNRIFVPAHTTNYGVDHLPSQRHLDYHVARARGGVSAIIFESIRVQENCLGRPQAVGGFERRCIPAFERIGQAVRAEGARLLGQIIHLGRQVDGDFERTVSWGPSAIPWSATAAIPHAMTEDDMQTVIDGHVATARNLLEAGLDGIEIQAGHGHLLQQFMSPASNQRDDAYGGSLENRLRFPLAVIAAVRAAVGADFCVGIRVSAEEFIDGGLHLDEMRRIAPLIATAVPLDFVNVSHSAYQASYSLATQMADMGIDPVIFRHLPGEIRDSLRQAGVDTPVLGVCRFKTLAEAEEVIAAGRMDMVGMARAHIAEPAIVRKTIEGRSDEIRRCISCNQGCAGMLEKNMAVRCVVNPRAGIEGLRPEPEADRTPAPRRVVVVGGGPGGLEAAWVAAARGHDVRLLERAPHLGGQLDQIRRLPGRTEFLSLLDYQLRQLTRFGVAVTLGEAASAASIAALQPDVVVLATGSTPQALPLPGGGAIATLAAAIAEPDRLGQRVAFVDLTGEWASLSVVEHLADLGKRVTLICPSAPVAWRTTIYSTLATHRRLREKGGRILTLRKALHWDGRTLELEDLSCGERETHAFDGLVVARYNRVCDELHAPLRASGVDLHLLGDCLAPRTAMEAVYEGHLTACSL